MIDHVSFSVKDYNASVKFYDETLKLIGLERLATMGDENYQMALYGENGKAEFVIIGGADPEGNEVIGKARGFHLAFRAPSIAAIKAWHKKSLELGAEDNGAPGPRAEYHPGFYGGFIIDPNGWRLEAVLHDFKA